MNYPIAEYPAWEAEVTKHITCWYQPLPGSTETWNPNETQPSQKACTNVCKCTGFMLLCLAAVGCGCDGCIRKVREQQMLCTWMGRGYPPQACHLSCLEANWQKREGKGWDEMGQGLTGKEVAMWGGTYNWKIIGRKRCKMSGQAIGLWRKARATLVS